MGMRSRVQPRECVGARAREATCSDTHFVRCVQTRAGPDRRLGVEAAGPLFNATTGRASASSARLRRAPAGSGGLRRAPVAVIDRAEDQLPRSNAEVFVVEERLQQRRLALAIAADGECGTNQQVVAFAHEVGRPEDIAATVAFLVSPPAAAFVGQILQPNGGTTRGLA
jgi:NAD(P)-dependent dehydrogenase (short-subunit alcohol dehydrogenase family)